MKSNQAYSNILLCVNQDGKHAHQYQANFIIYSSRMISLNPGRLAGSLSQHFFISFVKPSGHLGGIVGLSSRFSTYSDTLAPLMLRYGGSREAISHRIIE